MAKHGGKRKNAGRKKGTKSQKVKHWEELGEFVLEKGAEKYMNYLKDLEPKDYMSRFEAILEYFQPKLSRAEVTNDGEQTLNIRHSIGKPKKKK
jgi:hypothetical protein